jgi:hypothetical protein
MLSLHIEIDAVEMDRLVPLFVSEILSVPIHDVTYKA